MNKTTLACQELLQGEAEAITRKAVTLALQGDLIAIKLCLERTVPVKKEAPVSVDLPAMSALIFATPVKFSGRVLQYLGRVLRPAPGKCTPKVFDYVDPVGVLVAAARARQRVYMSA